MQIVVGSMLMLFALAGAALLVNAALELLRVMRRKHALVKATGVVREVVKEWHVGDGSQKKSGGLSRRNYRFFPVIEFERANGVKTRFKSSIGDTGAQTRYQVGQQLPVLYDPQDVLEPMIDTRCGAAS